MSKKSDAKSKKPSSHKADAAAKRRAPRRTRMIALEPRMLFDGALGIDLSAKATAALQGDTPAAADTAAPAAPQPQTEAPAAPAAAEKSVVEKTAERLGIAPEAPVRNEIVFVDPSVRDFQALIDGIDNPSARIVLLDATRDGVQQVAEVLKQYKSVDTVHIISHGSEGQLDLGSSVLNSITMSGT
jgi:hypothetical protein